MSIHPNAASRPSKANITDPEELLEVLLSNDPRPRRKDAEREVIKRFGWWNPLKPGWRPLGFSSVEKECDEARSASYQTRREEVLRQRQQRERRQGEEQARMGQEHPSGSNREKGIEPFFEEGDKGIREWTLHAAKSSYYEFLIEDHHTAERVVQILFAALGRMKDERDAAISLISMLIKERRRVRAHMGAQDRAAERSNSLYRKVGLDEHCPNHVLTAARRSFRVILHPDTYPAHMRGEAERRFKETEAIFEEIKRLRGP